MKVLTDSRWLTGRLSLQTTRSRVFLHLSVFGCSLLWLSLVFFAACIDGTRVLPGNGKGFYQHAGYMALHMATPIALSLALLSVDCYARLMSRFDDFLRPGCAADFRDILQGRLDILNLHSRWTWLLVLFVSVGALCSCKVLLQVITPTITYGNDVFNAVRYPFGYYTANTYLALSWTLIFPFSLFAVLQTTASLVYVLMKAREGSALIVDLLHPDNCGGLAEFGNLNLLLMLYYVPPFVAMYALALTHSRKYATLFVPAAALSLVFVIQSVVGVYAIHLAISAEKRMRLATLHDILDRALLHPSRIDQPQMVFSLWQHVRGVRTMPYASNIASVVNAVRYLPPVITVLGFLHIVSR
jgi:hypothetical protein